MISSHPLAFSSPKSHLRVRLPSLPSSPSNPCRRLPFPRCAAAAPAAAATTTTRTLYDVLRVPAGATGGEIKAAYRRLARECHPDVGAPADDFIRLHDAYATLSDPERRAEYDRRVMAAAVAAAAAAAAAGPGYRRSSRRTWETDQCW